jgi:Mannosyl-glycoprotein endo-beta-N-acetylglucosaminidase
MYLKDNFQKTLNILQDLEEGDAREGLFACFAVTMRGEVIYFDETGTPYSVIMRGATLMKSRPLNLPSQAMTIISTQQAFERITRAQEHYYLAKFIINKAKLAKKSFFGKFLFSLLIVGGIALMAWWAWFRTPVNSGVAVDLGEMKVIASGNYNPIAPPSISYPVFREFLRESDSPAYPEAETMYRACLKEGCDPALVLAFFEHESSMGKMGVAVQTKSIGNIRCTPSYSCYTTEGNGSFRKYNSWADSVTDWAKLLKFYRDEWKLVTIDQIIPVYAPAADKNNPNAYIEGVKKRVEQLRARELALNTR